MKVYFNHTPLENASDTVVKKCLSEIMRLSMIVHDKQHEIFFHEQFWNILLLDGNLRKYVYGLNDRDHTKTIIATIMNYGPWFDESQKVPSISISPGIKGTGFGSKLLHICYGDKQELILSLSGEATITTGAYTLTGSAGILKVKNLTSEPGLLNFFKSDVVFNCIDDVFTMLNPQNNCIHILDSARKSAAKHNFFGCYQEVFTTIMALEKIELNLLLNNENTEKRKSAFMQATGFEISEESSATLNIARYRKQREFVIPSQGNKLFEWHIKIGNHTRIHYFIDLQNKCVFIGHCGRHLGVSSYNS